MRFVKFFKLLTQTEYKSKFASLAIFGTLSLVTLVSYQNCSKQRFSSASKNEGVACATPPCVTCNFSGAEILTSPENDYDVGEAITFHVEDTQYTTITWSFYRDTNNNGEPDSGELMTGTPTTVQPTVSFTPAGNYIAVADLAKGDDCETRILKILNVVGGDICTDPTGINGPSIAYVGDTQTFSIAKPACFTGTANWDMDIPRNGSPNGNEHNNVNANNPVPMVYTAAHANAHGGLYTVKATVTSGDSQFQLYKDVDVRFKTCSFNNQTIPGNGTTFNAYNVTQATCATGCEMKQFRCDNGAIVAVDGVSNIVNYPANSCAAVTPGTCTTGQCGVVPPFYVKPANTVLCAGGTIASFLPSSQPSGLPINSAQATWSCNGSSGAVSCSSTWCHQDQILRNNQCYTCAGGGVANAGHLSCTCPVTGSTYDYVDNRCECSSGQVPVGGTCVITPTTCNVYVGSSLVGTLNNGASQTRYAQSSSCGQACLSDTKTCTNGQNINFAAGYTYTTAGSCPQAAACPTPNIEIIFSKTNNGSHITNFSYNADSLFGRVENGGPNVRGCTVADVDDPTHPAQETALSACDGNPTQSPWVPITNYNFSSTRPHWSYASSVWRFNGKSTITNDNRLYGHELYIPGRYKSCVYNPETGKKACATIIITADAPDLVVSKTSGGSDANSYAYDTDSLFMRVTKLSHLLRDYQNLSMTRGCSAADATDPNHPAQDITYCDVANPATSSRYKDIPNNDWECTNGRCDFKGFPNLSGVVTHKLKDSKIWVPGNYKVCMYNKHANKNTCKSITITGQITPTCPSGQAFGPNNTCMPCSGSNAIISGGKCYTCGTANGASPVGYSGVIPNQPDFDGKTLCNQGTTIPGLSGGQIGWSWACPYTVTGSFLSCSRKIEPANTSATYAWNSGAFGECRYTGPANPNCNMLRVCEGMGDTRNFRTRTVTCRNTQTSEIVADSSCINAGPKPSVQEDCMRPVNDPCLHNCARSFGPSSYWCGGNNNVIGDEGCCGVKNTVSGKILCP